MKSRTACFTGHRKIKTPTGDILPLTERLLKTISELTGKGVTRFLNGGAIGFDSYAALAVLHARRTTPSIELEMILPHKRQAENWSEADSMLYSQILSQADTIAYVSDAYYHGCMEARNLRLVENSCVCVAYLTHRRSGTGQTVRFATERNLSVINLAEQILR